MVFVWQYTSTINKSALATSNRNTGHDNLALGEPSSELPLAPDQHIENTQNIFFIHHLYNDKLYSRTFTNHLPDVAIKQNCIVILNDNKILNIAFISIESLIILVYCQY
jgi:hypothetical protein